MKDLEEPTDADLWPTARAQLLASEEPSRIGPIVDRFRQQTRIWCEDDLLPAWGSAFLAGDRTTATGHLNRIARVGQVLFDVSGEQDVRDAVAAIESSQPPQRGRLARGHVAYGAARASIIHPNAREAVRLTSIAVAELSPSITPFAWRARVEHAAAVYLSNDYLAAISELNDLLDEIPASRRSAAGLVARTHWVLGISSLQTGKPKIAIDEYSLALDGYRRAGESDYESAMHALLARAYDVVGREREAQQHRHDALSLLAQTGNADRRHLIVFEAAYAAINQGDHAVADLLLDAVVEHDVADGNFVTGCTSLVWRSEFRYKRGRIEESAADLEHAERFCRSIADEDVRTRAIANLGLARAMLRPQGTAQRELDDLDASIDYYNRTSSHIWLGTAYLTRARIFEARREIVAAERDYLAALKEASTTRRTIDERPIRMSFSATADEVADGYVEFLLKQRRNPEALQIADRSRARELVESANAQWNAPEASVLDDVGTILSSRTAIIAYRVLGDRIVCWVVRDRKTDTEYLPASVADVRAELNRLTGNASAADINDALTRLHAALIAPIETALEDSDTLLIVPDDDLERVPYSGLYDERRHRFVMETHNVVVLPSLALLIPSVRRFEDRLASPERVLVVNAAAAGETMDALPESADEARSIAAVFPGAVMLDRGNKSPAVLDAVRLATILHFAVHGVRDESMRVLRIGDGKAGLLTAAEIAAAAMPHARIAYLSACDTDIGPIFKSEGGVTIARSFFAAGVPVVVATLWPVDDMTARQVAESFYDNYLAGAAPAEALRRAQLRVLSHRPGSRPDWAAYRVLGAGIPLPKRKI